MAKHHGGKHHHTGPIRHKGMTSLLHGQPGKDPHADPAHHAANKAHGMDEGLSPTDGYGGGGEGGEGEGMAGNAECYE